MAQEKVTEKQRIKKRTIRRFPIHSFSELVQKNQLLVIMHQERRKNMIIR